MKVSNVDGVPAAGLFWPSPFQILAAEIIEFVDDMTTKAHLDLVDTAIVDLKKAPASVMVS